MFVADDVTRRPPRADIRVRGVGRQDCSEAAVRAFLFINLQLVHPFEVEDDAPFASVDLEAAVVLATPCEARAFYRTDGAPAEVDSRERAVIHVHKSRL